MDAANRLFLDAMKASLENRKVDLEAELSDEELIQLFRVAFAHNLLPMVFQAIYGSPAIENADTKLIASVSARIQRSVMTQKIKNTELIRLMNSLVKAGATPLIVKGAVCRSIYPVPDFRESGDEDIFIPEEQFEICHKVFAENVYDLVEPEKDIYTDYEVPYMKPNSPIYIELHKHLFPPDSDAYGDLNRFFEGAHLRAITANVYGLPMPTLCHTDHMLYLICHAFKHFLHCGFGVRQICDICLYANTYGNEIDWQRVYSACSEINADVFVAAVFRIGEKYLTFSPEKSKICDSFMSIDVDETNLLDEILESGIFGSGTLSRLHSSTMTLNAVTADKNGQKANGSVIKTIFPSAKNLSGSYPYLKTKPYLLPIAWINRIIKYKKETETQTQDNSAVDAMRIGNERIELLREYKVIK